MNKNIKITLPAIISALAIVFLYASSIMPTVRLTFVAVAGVIMFIPVIECGVKYASVCYAITVLLSFLIVPDKGNVLMFTAFFGHYPIVKSLIERIGKLIPEWIIKLAIFNVSVVAMYFLMIKLFTEFIPESFPVLWVLIVVGSAAFAVYDIGLTKLITYYMQRLRRHLYNSGNRN